MTDDELLKEFLAKGGKITKLPCIKPESKDVTVKKTNNGPMTIYSLPEGEFLFTKKRTRKTEKKKYTNEEFNKLMSNFKSSKK